LLRNWEFYQLIIPGAAQVRIRTYFPGLDKVSDPAGSGSTTLFLSLFDPKRVPFCTGTF
jgi:hypothetical protein